MLGIPPAIDTDAEDVVWALQTADALWKREERVDAIVWLRRAAQAAGEANDDDRAFTLARNAAELAEKIAREASPVSEVPETTGAFAVDELLGQDVGHDADADAESVIPESLVPESVIPESIVPESDDEHEEVDVDELSISDGVAAKYRTPTPTPVVTDTRRLSSPRPPPPRSPLPPAPQNDAGRVPTAAEAHAGMLDPWAEAEAPTGVQSAPPAGPAAIAPPHFDSDEVVTSAPHVILPEGPKVRPPPLAPLAPLAPAPVVAVAPPPVPLVPPVTAPGGPPQLGVRPGKAPPPRPGPPRPRVESAPAIHVDLPAAQELLDLPVPPDPMVDLPTPAVAPVVLAAPSAPAAPAVPAEPPAAAPSKTALPRATRPGAPSPQARAAAPAKTGTARSPHAPAPADAPAQAPAPAPAKAPAPAPAKAPAPAPALDAPAVDLSRVEALSDLPEDSRDAFARAATIQDLAREDEVAGFALAFVLEGSVDVAATIIDAPAQRLEAGAILRSRGTIDHVAPVRLLVASPRARVAIWDDRAVAEAFRTCPWVEDELRVAGDRLQALVGLTMGPLGERLDPSLRADVTNRLQLRTLGEHEVFAKRGAPSPGLLVVGAGELELVGEDGAPTGTVIRAGEFLFPSEVLRAAPVPFTVRAAKGGALVLLAERRIAQELLVTCPPLLEIFSGG